MKRHIDAKLGFVISLITLTGDGSLIKCDWRGFGTHPNISIDS